MSLSTGSSGWCGSWAMRDNTSEMFKIVVQCHRWMKLWRGVGSG
jgi:hypothetical protein